MLTTSTCDIQKLFSVACLPGEAHCSIKKKFALNTKHRKQVFVERLFNFP